MLLFLTPNPSSFTYLQQERSKEKQSNRITCQKSFPSYRLTHSRDVGRKAMPNGILLGVNSSLINIGTYSQKHTNLKRKHKCFTTKTMHYLYI